MSDFKFFNFLIKKENKEIKELNEKIDNLEKKIVLLNNDLNHISDVVNHMITSLNLLMNGVENQNKSIKYLYSSQEAIINELKPLPKEHISLSKSKKNQKPN